MSRVYYRESYIKEATLKESSVINKAEFNSIITNFSKKDFESSQILKIPSISPLKFWKNKDKRFKYAIIWTEEKMYNFPRLGNFHAPKSICFFDVQDFYFPSDFYFVALLDGELEFRECHAGEGVKWMEIADMHSFITEDKLLRRIENSFKGLKELFPDE